MKIFLSRLGFSLLEIIIYIALSGMLILGGWAVVFQLMVSAQKNEARLTAEIDKSFLRGKLAWAIEGAESVTVTAGSLTVTRRDALVGENPLLFEIKTDNTLYLRRGSSPAVALTAVGTVAAKDGTSPFQYNALSRSVTVNFDYNHQIFTSTYYLP